MQIAKLRISGFKSFVETTEVTLEPGLTGIVGPNGCGKSNIVDALKWVMGETSAKQLRGGEMDDVIFAGTQNRPARNFSEVVLTLDNALRKAPAQFNDSDMLEVSRRIDRGEGSTYKVNAKDSRARDIQVLFADASTGAHSTAIVSQGRVGHLCNAKPVERRALLEEAAGITGLRARRHEAELRLNAAENNLKRGEDLLNALNAQLAHVKKQARQAAQYRSLAERFRQAEALMFHHEWQGLSAKLSEAETALARLDGELQELETQIHAADTERAEVAATIPELRQKEAERAAALQRLKIAEHELTGEESRLASAQAALEQRLQQIANDSAREESLLQDAQKTISDLSGERETVQTAQDNDEASREELKLAAAAASDAVEIAGSAVQELNDRLFAEETKFAKLQERKQALENRREKLEDELLRVTAERKSVEELLAADDTLQRCLEEVVFAEAALENAKNAAQKSESARATAQESEASLRRELQGAESNFSKIKAEHAALTDLIASDKEIENPIMDQLTIESGYEAALGAALGDDLLASLDENAAKHWFMLPPLSSLPALPGGVQSLASYVEAPGVLHRSLHAIGVVMDAAQGKALQSELQVGQRLVSLTGDLWRWDGFIASSTAAKPATVRLEQRNRLAALEKELASAESLRNEAATSYQQAAQAWQEAQSADNAARSSLDAAYAELNRARNVQSQAAQRTAESTARLSSLADQIARAEAELSEVASSLEGVVADISGAPDFQSMREELQQKRADLEQKRQVSFETRAKSNDAEREAASRMKRLQDIASQLQNWESRAASGTQRIADLGERKVQAESEREALASRPAELAAQREALLTQIQEADQSRGEAAEVLSNAEARLNEADKKSRALSQQAGGFREERARFQTTLEHGTADKERILSEMQERCEATPDKLLELANLKEGDEIPPVENTAARLERLKRERDNMGPVNLRAEEEVKELEAKQEQMMSEQQELVEAIGKLRTAISTLNKEGRERLLEAFNKVNENFQKLFTRLFGGGKAHLEWTEHEDPLEAGLEIIASPPGKKLQQLSLLSGGERALTATALLFAVFQSNPAPLCVLDEVDAPLDESNVDRFCTLLEEMAKQTETRYLVVTHHRMTMSRMHRLYGVTMAEPGVSQLVSVDLQQAENMRATA